VKPKVCNRKLPYIKEKDIKNHKKKHTENERGERDLVTAQVVTELQTL
jgi:hypothetical protein